MTRLLIYDLQGRMRLMLKESIRPRWPYISSDDASSRSRCETADNVGRSSISPAMDPRSLPTNFWEYLQTCSAPTNPPSTAAQPHHTCGLHSVRESVERPTSTQQGPILWLRAAVRRDSDSMRSVLAILMVQPSVLLQWRRRPRYANAVDNDVRLLASLLSPCRHLSPSELVQALSANTRSPAHRCFLLIEVGWGRQPQMQPHAWENRPHEVANGKVISTPPRSGANSDDAATRLPSDEAELWSCQTTKLNCSSHYEI